MTHWRTDRPYITSYLSCHILHWNLILFDKLNNYFIQNRFAWQQPGQHSALFQCAVSRGPRVLVQCIAINITLLRATFKAGAANVLLRLANTQHI